MTKRKLATVRRGKGEGSIYQENNKWVGAIRIEQPDGTKVRKKVRGDSKAEVSKKMVELTGKLDFLKNSGIQNRKFGEIFDEWLQVFKKNTVSARTFETSMLVWKKHIKPYLYNLEVFDITTATIQQLLNEMMAFGYQTQHKKTKFLLNQFFEYCIENGFVKDNPVTRVKLKNPRTVESEKENLYKAIPKDLRMKFINDLNQHDLLKPVCMIAMFAGLRIGEILGLKWQDIDFNNKIIHVRRSIIVVPVFDSEGNIIKRPSAIGKTKTACSIRSVPVPDILLEALKDWKKQQWVRQQLTAINFLDDDHLVFLNADGTLREYGTIRRIYDRFAKKNGYYGKIHLHTLRHTYSNMLFEANENPKIIQALLGHKSVKTTLTVYNSIDESYHQEAVEKLNKLFTTEKMDEFKELAKKKDTPALKRPMSEIDEKENEDPEIAMLEKILAEKKAKQQKDLEEKIKMENLKQLEIAKTQKETKSDRDEFEEFLKWKAIKRNQEEEMD